MFVVVFDHNGSSGAPFTTRVFQTLNRITETESAAVNNTTSAAPAEEAGASTAGLEHLTGPARGTMTWLPAEALDICTPGNHILRVAAANQCGDRLLLARLHPADDGDIIVPQRQGAIG